MLIPLLNVMNSVVKLPKNTILGSITKVDNAENYKTYTHWNIIISRLTSRPSPLNPCYQHFPIAPASQHMHTAAVNHQFSNTMQNIPLEIQCKLHTMLIAHFTGIISNSAADFGRTNLIEMDLPPTSFNKTLHHTFKVQSLHQWWDKTPWRCRLHF